MTIFKCILKHKNGTSIQKLSPDDRAVCSKDTHILQVIWEVKAQNSNFASKQKTEWNTVTCKEDVDWTKK